jgi:hypothetical protein
VCNKSNWQNAQLSVAHSVCDFYFLGVDIYTQRVYNILISKATATKEMIKMTESAKSKNSESLVRLLDALNQLDDKDLSYVTGYADGVLSAKPTEENPKDKKE